MALDSGDPAGIVVLNSGDPVLIQRLSSCDSVSDQHRAIRQKQLSSAGSYDNLEAEDLCDLGIQLDYSPGQNGHTGFVSNLVQKLRPDSGEAYTEDYCDRTQSEGDQPRVHPPTAPSKTTTVQSNDSSVASSSSGVSSASSSLASPTTSPLTAQLSAIPFSASTTAPPLTKPPTTISSPTTIAPLTKPPTTTGPLANQSTTTGPLKPSTTTGPLKQSTTSVPWSTSTNSVSPSCTSASTSPQPMVLQPALPDTSIHLADTHVSCSLTHLTAAVHCATASNGLSTSSGLVTVAEGTVKDRVSWICLQDGKRLHSRRSNLRSTTAGPVQLMVALDGDLGVEEEDDVEKDWSCKKAANGKPSGTGEASSQCSDLGMGSRQANADSGAHVSTSQAANSQAEAATSSDGIGGMSSTNQTTIANGVQTPTRHTPEDRPGTGRVQAKCPLHTGSSISHPGHVDRRRQGSDPGKVSVFLKKKSFCDVSRAYSEPTASDLVTADLLTEITMTPLSDTSSQSFTESIDSVSSYPPSEQDISTCIKTRCKDFLKYTNWKLLLPHLHANELLDSDITDVLMSNYQTNRDKGLVFYLSVLPSKGHTAYSRFYQCLLEEEEHSGHRTLLELLDDFNKT